MIVLKDTREKKGWDFSAYGVEMRNATLKTGDYTVVGLEDKFIIERKASLSELAICLGKGNRRFYNELKRMETIPDKYIVCEFPFEYIHIFPAKSGIPKYLWPNIKITSQQILAHIQTIQDKYGITFMFCTSKEEAEMAVFDLIHGITNKYHT